MKMDRTHTLCKKGTKSYVYFSKSAIILINIHNTIVLLICLSILDLRHSECCVRIITFTHYLDTSNPLFRKLKKKLVVYRMSLTIVPKYISMMFQKNNDIHKHNSATHFILLWGNIKLLIRLLVLGSGIIC